MKYLIGKTLIELSQNILLSSLMPTTHSFLRGFNYLYDLRCLLDRNADICIFDVGANMGQTTKLLNRVFVKANIFAFEPVKNTYNVLLENTSKMDRVRAFNYALGASCDEKNIRLFSNSLINTLVDLGDGDAWEEENREFSTEVVKVDTIDSFCENNGIKLIDLLKVDVEGFEIEVMKGARQFLCQKLIRCIYSEVSFINGDKKHQSFVELHDYLTDYGFQLYGFYEISRTRSDFENCISYCNALFTNSMYRFG